MMPTCHLLYMHNVKASMKRYDGLEDATVIFEFADLLLLVAAFWTPTDRSRLIKAVKLLVLKTLHVLPGFASAQK